MGGFTRAFLISVVVASGCGGGDDGPTPGFSLELAPASLLLSPSTTGTTTVTVVRDEGFAGAVDVAVEGLPAGVTAAPINIAETATTGQLVLSAAGTAAPATGAVATIVGASGDVEARASLTVDIRALGGFDTAFGVDGLVATPVVDTTDLPVAIERQADGKLLVLATTGPSRRTALLRYLTTGGIDTAFGKTGMLEPDGNLAARALATSGGKVLVVGATAITRVLDTGVTDGTYGTNGVFQLAFGELRAVAVQPDGKLLVNGRASSGFESGVLRVLPDGGLDPAFGLSGIVRYTTGSPTFGVALQSDGKPVVLRSTFVTSRFTATGAVDATFNSAGALPGSTTPPAALSSSTARAVVMQGDNILVAGERFIDSLTAEFVVLRYLADGTVDPAFGTGGFTQIPGTGLAHAITLATNGDIVIAGRHTQNSSATYARLDANGAVVTTFGTNGVVVRPTRAVANALDPGGALVSAGFEPFTLSRNIVLERLLDTGELDATFGTGGTLSTNLKSSVDDALKLVLDGNSPVMLGSSLGREGFAAGAAFARYNADGVLDAAFGTGGIVATAASLNVLPRAIAPQPDGKFVVAGRVTTASFDTLTRYDSTGQDGTFVNPTLTTFRTIRDVRLLADGKILVVGDRLSTQDFLIKRFASNGASAPFVSGSDELVLDASGSNRADLLRAVAIDGTGRLTMVGETVNTQGRKDFVVVRIDATKGLLDQSFGINGFVRTEFGGDDSASAIALQPDGKLVVAGVTGTRIAVARYLDNGMLDTSFAGGSIATAIGNSTHNVTGIELQTDGRIVLVGDLDDVGRKRAFVLRITVNGVVDPTFGTNGSVVWPVTQISRAIGIQRLADGKLVVGGVVRNSVTSEDFALWRIAP